MLLFLDERFLGLQIGVECRGEVNGQTQNLSEGSESIHCPLYSRTHGVTWECTA